MIFSFISPPQGDCSQFKMCDRDEWQADDHHQSRKGPLLLKDKYATFVLHQEIIYWRVYCVLIFNIFLFWLVFFLSIISFSLPFLVCQPDDKKPFTFDFSYWSSNPKDPHFATQERVRLFSFLFNLKWSLFSSGIWVWRNRCAKDLLHRQ